MSFWPDVKKGDAYKPSASLENHVRHFFNGSANISDGKGSLKISNGNRVRVINNTSETIGAYEPIYITGRSNDPEQLDLYVAPATQDELLWGIAANTIEANSDGAMIISGIAQAYITGTGEYASPGADGKLVAGTSGKALILHPGDDKTPGIVQLGYSAAGGYNGYFKAILVPVADAEEPSYKVAIVDGATYDPSTITSGVNVCKVNNTIYLVPSFLSEPLDLSMDEIIFALKFSPISDEETGGTVAGEIEIVNLSEHEPPYSALPNDTNDSCWLQLCRVIIADKNVKLIQDNFGMPTLLWFAECSSVESEDGESEV